STFFAQIQVWNKTESELLVRHNGSLTGLSACLFHGGCKLGEEIVSKFFGRTVDQPLPELCELAANLRLHRIREQSAPLLWRQHDRSAAFGEAADAAIALT